MYKSTVLNEYHKNWASWWVASIKSIALNKTPSQSYGVSLAIWDHTVLPETQHKSWTHPALTPARQAGTRFTYPGGMEGWVDLGDLLHTVMVFPPADGHPCTRVSRLLNRQRAAGSRTRDQLRTTAQIKIVAPRPRLCHVVAVTGEFWERLKSCN